MRLVAALALVGGLLATIPAPGLPAPRLVPPGEVIVVVGEFALPPGRPGEAPPPIDQLPFTADAMKDYAADVSAADILANPGKYPLRVEVLEAFGAIRELWTPPPAVKDKKDKKERTRPLFETTLRSPVTEADKRQLLENQLFPARAIVKLELILEDLERVAPLRAKEPKRWQAHFDLARAEVAGRITSLHEYDLLIGDVRRDELPPLDPAKGQNGWRLVGSEKMNSKKDVRELAEMAREWFTKIADEHKGTPWAAAARRELATPPGLKWEPAVVK